MVEVFKPRENMVFDKITNSWECRNDEGQLVCDGGPSIIWDDGSWLFYISKIGYHRLDGPASSEGEWRIRGKNITPDIRAFAKDNNIDLENLTDENKVMIIIFFS